MKPKIHHICISIFHLPLQINMSDIRISMSMRMVEFNICQNLHIFNLKKILLSLIGLHTWYHVVSLDCLKASDEQIGFSTTPPFQLLRYYKFFILYSFLSKIQRSANCQILSLANTICLQLAAELRLSQV